jgi:predicted MFS family arabinose efflux permease
VVTASTVATDNVSTRRLVALISSLFILEASMFACIAPLLPHYVHQFSLSKRGAGILAGSYAAGLILGSLMVGRYRRVNPRTWTVIGLALVSAATAALGLANHIAVLDGARLAQGIGSSGIWGGGLAWLTQVINPARRGRAFGFAFGAAMVGMMFGPLFGTVAAGTDPRVVFGGVAAIAALLAVVTRAAERPPDVAGPAASMLRLFRNRSSAICQMMIAVPIVAEGALNVLLPLRLTGLGAGSLAVGVTFVAAAGVASLVSPIAGRLSDSTSPVLPIRIGLVFGAACLSALPLVQSPIVVAILAVGYLGAALSLATVPAFAMLTDVAEGTEYATVAPATVLLVIGIAALAGATGGAALAQASSDTVVCLSLAGLAVGALVVFGGGSQRSVTQ